MKAVSAAMALLFWAAAATCAGESNPVTGRQEREAVFEFAAKPKVEKQGDKYIISFASKAACDATVAVVDKDGKIVRHLASGVLGKNAPAPFKQNSLSQSVEWDGKDDAGKPAPAGCKVRVGLGLDAGLDRFLGWSPEAMPMKVPCGVAVGPRGDVFVLTGGNEGSGLQSISSHVYVYGPDGGYLRRILPQEASVPPERATFMDWAKTTWGTSVPQRHMSYIMNSICRSPAWANAGQQTPVVTADGRFVFYAGGQLIMLDVRDGATPPGSIVEIKDASVLGSGRPEQMALSPDGKWLYLTGVQYDPWEKDAKEKNAHAIFRMSMDKPGELTAFLGEYRKSGDDQTHFNMARAVACDKAGNVYVADFGNNRIQVFKADGSHLKSLEIKGPERVAVSAATGEIYVIHENGPRTRTLVKMGGLDDAGIKARLDIPGVQHTFQVPSIALDVRGTLPAVWMSKADYGGNFVKRLEDRGNAFVETANLIRQDKGWEGWCPWSPLPYIFADPFREELYIRDAGMCYPNNVFRVDGRTGKVIETLAFNKARQFESACVGADRMVYMRVTMNGNWIARYDPDKGQFAAFPGATEVETYNVQGVPEGKLAYKGQPVMGFCVPTRGTARNAPDVMGMAPNGDFYVPTPPMPEAVEELKKAGISNPDVLLRVYSQEGKLKSLQALPGFGLSCGVRIGKRGEAYAAMELQPAGQAAPEGIGPGIKWDPATWGTLVKFNSVYDKYPIGSMNEDKAKPSHTRSLRKYPVRLEGAAWGYAGVSPLAEGGGTACCRCWKSVFDLDRFERSFVPASQTCTVNVLDANGNIVVRLGGYGNPDSRGKDSPVPDPKTGEYRPRRADDPPDLKSPLAVPEIAFAEPAFVAVTDEAMYVHDRGNERIVRAALRYQAEETVPLP